MDARSGRRAALSSLRPAFALLVTTVLGACGGGGAPPPVAPAPAAASDAEWRALATQRPEPVAGAPRVSLGTVEVLADDPWGNAGLIDSGLAVTELAAAGLLRRRDVEYVERRRFAAAVDAERQGRVRPDNAPAAGTSAGATYVVEARWASVGMASAYLELRVTEVSTGLIAQTWRGATPPDADAAGVARTVVAGTLAALAELGVRPTWPDPIPAAAPSDYQPSGVPASALQAFFRGLVAEERWDWEGARRGYQAAITAGGTGFFEAQTALARAARLRNGGTLGAS